jgi:anti-sigma B factor antagonist
LNTDAAALKIRHRWEDRIAIAAVNGEIDVSTAGALSERLDWLAGKNPQRLVIDLAGVSFMDSSGLNALVLIRNALLPDCTVVIRSPRPRIRHLFTITGLDPLFSFE